MTDLQISSAEWQVMRVVWANQPVTSRQIIDILIPIMDWKEGTIKSLINRLIQKKMLIVNKQAKPYQYSAATTEEGANLSLLDDQFQKICSRNRGQAIRRLIEVYPLSIKDCQNILDVVQNKMETAPEQVPCSCPIGQCHCHQHS